MLHEQDDFVDLLATVGVSEGAAVALIEKDYWVSASLRAIASNYDHGVIFKGGTSLSKGHKLINRFSEDIDLLIVPDQLGLESGGQRDRFMKEIASSVGQIEGLSVKSGAGRADRRTSRTVVFEYEPRSDAMAGLETTVILEMGIRGGANPHEVLPLNSMVGEALVEAGNTTAELQPFRMEVLSPKRTLIEKLSALHSGVVRWAEGDERALRRITRHYTDVDSLLTVPNILEFVGTDDYYELLREVQATSSENFPNTHRNAEGDRFSESPLMTPTGNLLDALNGDFNASSSIYYKGLPVLTESIDRIADRKDLL